MLWSMYSEGPTQGRSESTTRRNCLVAEDFYFFVTEMVPSTITRTLKHGVYWYSSFVMNLLGQYRLAEMPTIPPTLLWNISPLNSSVAISFARFLALRSVLVTAYPPGGWCNILC